MIKQNKGEWSEFTTKLEILSNKAIKVISSNDKEDVCVVRSIQMSDKLFKLLGKSIYEVKKDNSGEEQVKFVTFDNQIKKELEPIHKKIKNGRGSFMVKEAEKVAKTLGVSTCSEHNHNKGDINLEYIQADGKVSPLSSFSIKSFVGNNPTILNSSIHSTRVKLRITGLSDEVLEKLKSNPQKARDNVREILALGGGFRFVKFSDTLGANLGKLNAQKQIVFAIISHFCKTDNVASKFNIIEKSSKDYKLDTFRQAIKRVLRSSLTGMMPSEHWNGECVISDNLILKKSDGSCLAFLNKESLEDYLYNNCYIDSPSQTKHRYGKIYKEDNQWFIDLNFQIRLAKSNFKK